MPLSDSSPSIALPRQSLRLLSHLGLDSHLLHVYAKLLHASLALCQISGEDQLKKLHSIFPQKESLPYFGVPGLGLNAGVALMNLTRFFFSTSLLQALKITYLYLSFSDYGIYLGAVSQKYPGLFGKSTGWPCTMGIYLIDQAIE